MQLGVAGAPEDLVGVLPVAIKVLLLRQLPHGARLKVGVKAAAGDHVAIEADDQVTPRLQCLMD